MSPAACAPQTKPASVSRSPISHNCMTVDIEEYFQAEAFAACLDPADWPRISRRAEPFVERIVRLLERHGSRATFFVLGDCVEQMGALLRELVQRGHEIACHGYDHQHLARLTPEQLCDDLRRARHAIEDVVGVSPLGYRAPTFSVTRATAWALDIIIAEGFQYDASIFPIRHDRYGVPGAPSGPFWALAPSGACILEFPPLTLNCGLLRVPVGGGGYLRLLPEAIVHRCLAARERRGNPALIYVHPWELDPDQPDLPLGALAHWRHRVNLHKTESKLEQLLQAHRFDTARSILDDLRTHRDLPTFKLTE